MGHSGLVLTFILAAMSAAADSSLDVQKRREAESAYRRGEELMRSESFAEAAVHFRTAIKLDPLFSIAHYSLGQAHMALKQYPQAVEAYLGCRESFERIATLSVEDQNALEKAREDEVRDLKDSLQRVQAGQIKGNSLALEVGIQERLRVLEGARLKGRERRVGVPAEVMLALGSAYFRNGQLAEAEPAYVEAVQTDPRLGAAHNNLGVIYMMTGRFPEASEALKRAEKSGFPVSAALKSDLEQRTRAAGVKR
jgi:tetratricopeptide (TPR) repeat protein